ncbi:hypothetical protein B0H19DRAFT_1228981 [Mycena capillaripes]|nr:hypothetical protein B0H19DRAFT_1228981 [Mycena capillaripes]
MTLLKDVHMPARLFADLQSKILCAGLSKTPSNLQQQPHPPQKQSWPPDAEWVTSSPIPTPSFAAAVSSSKSQGESTLAKDDAPAPKSPSSSSSATEQEDPDLLALETRATRLLLVAHLPVSRTPLGGGGVGLVTQGGLGPTGTGPGVNGQLRASRGRTRCSTKRSVLHQCAPAPHSEPTEQDAKSQRAPCDQTDEKQVKDEPEEAVTGDPMSGEGCGARWEESMLLPNIRHAEKHHPRAYLAQ